MLNVRNSPYNAVGDGVHDDTIAIQAAINNALTSGGAVYFPTGQYLVSSELDCIYNTTSVSKGVCFLGDGASNTILLWGGTDTRSGGSPGTATSAIGAPARMLTGCTLLAASTNAALRLSGLPSLGVPTSKGTEIRLRAWQIFGSRKLKSTRLIMSSIIATLIALVLAVDRTIARTAFS